jgi:hypothetical protein
VRHEDQQHEHAHERSGFEDLRERLPHERPEVEGEEDELAQQDRRRAGGGQAGVVPTEMAEDDEPVRARHQQHEIADADVDQDQSFDAGLLGYLGRADGAAVGECRSSQGMSGEAVDPQRPRLSPGRPALGVEGIDHRTV